MIFFQVLQSWGIIRLDHTQNEKYDNFFLYLETKLTLIFIAKFLLFAIVIQVLSSVRAQDNPCDGNFGLKIADPRRCYGFIFCNINIPMYQDCQQGNIFDSLTRECLPGSSTTCQFFNFDAVCNGIFFGARPHPDEYNNQEFVGCIKSKPTVHVCNDDEIFDRETNKCIDLTRTQTPPTEGPNPCLGVQGGIK